MKSTLRWKFIAAVLGYAVACKVLPYILNSLHDAGIPIDPRQSWYPWNFSPFWAVFAFCGAIIPARRWAVAMPLLAMLTSDVLIYFVHGNQFFAVTDWLVQASVYFSFTMCGCLGLLFRSRPNWITGIAASLPGAALFFLTTNYAMWAFGEGRFYPETIDGLWACYAAGLPFFRTSLISTIIYAGLFFSPWGLSLAGVTPQRPQLEVMTDPVYRSARG